MFFDHYLKKFKKLINHLKFPAFSVVIAAAFVNSSALAGSFDDFFNAMRNDEVAVVRQLLARGFDPNTVDPEGRHGLMLAIAQPAPQIADLLAASPGLHVNFLNAAGESALMMAALKGQEALAARLIQRGADVNKTGWTPLHYAATSGHLGIMRLLIEHHAFVDPESPNGSTPLMMAARYGSPQAVKLLLDEGALVQLRNQQGLTALDFARLGARPDALEVLTQAARVQQPAGK